jgi:hypothetical protein
MYNIKPIKMIYLSPRISDYRKAVEGYVLFENNPSDKEKEAISLLIPFPLSLNLKWMKNMQNN